MTSEQSAVAVAEFRQRCPVGVGIRRQRCVARRMLGLAAPTASRTRTTFPSASCELLDERAAVADALLVRCDLPTEVHRPAVARLRPRASSRRPARACPSSQADEASWSLLDPFFASANRTAVVPITHRQNPCPKHVSEVTDILAARPNGRVGALHARGSSSGSTFSPTVAGRKRGMNRSVDRIVTSHAGSLPRPRELVRLMWITWTAKPSTSPCSRPGSASR